MIVEGLTFNNIHSSTFNLTIVDVSRPIFPELKDTYVDIPNKDGSVLIPDNSKKDVNVSVVFVVEPLPKETLMQTARKIGNWLYTEKRAPLIFDDDKEYVYGAKVSESIDLEQIVYHGRFTVNFRCLPYSIE